MALSSKDFWKGFFKGDRSLMGLEPFETRLYNKELVELAKKLNWKGEGTETDPIIIHNAKELPQVFSIFDSNLYIKIRDNRFEHVILYNCKNITLDNCSIKILGLFKSSKITTEYCDLTNLNLDHCSNSYFKDCSIENVGNLRSQGNIYEHCQLTQKVKKKLQEGLFNIPSFKSWPLIIILAGLTLATFTTIHIINSTPFSIYWYLSVVSFPILIIIFIYLSKSKKKEIPNKFISNDNLKNK